jgi:hypothetical protein
MKPGNAGGGKEPQFKTDARRGEGPGIGYLEAEVASMPDGAERAAMQVRLKEFRWTMHMLMQRVISEYSTESR